LSFAALNGCAKQYVRRPQACVRISLNRAKGRPVATAALIGANENEIPQTTFNSNSQI